MDIVCLVARSGWRLTSDQVLLLDSGPLDHWRVVGATAPTLNRLLSQRDLCDIQLSWASRMLAHMATAVLQSHIIIIGWGINANANATATNMLITLTGCRGVNFPRGLNWADPLPQMLLLILVMVTAIIRLLIIRSSTCGICTPGWLSTSSSLCGRVMLTARIVCIVVDGLGEVVLDDEERCQLKLGWCLTHLADYVLVTSVDNPLAAHGLPFERPKRWWWGLLLTLSQLAFLLGVIIYIWIIVAIVASLDQYGLTVPSLL